ncbi:acyltransferase family protein [Kitasatospora sp. NPDC058965]|uniref:acyltransferase family protein n=1 Tax=Kitasatospora sp. NPDC058965 TaxID=3346682 RepID=UPI00369AC93E
MALPQNGAKSGPAPARPAWLPALDGMRFVAAIIVFLFHFAFQMPFKDHWAATNYMRLLEKAGPMQVGFFFVLSGFILTLIAKPGEPLSLFFRRRITKVVPNHLVAWTIALVSMLAVGLTVDWHSALPNFFMLHPWFPQSKIFFSMDFVSWSLAAEAFFYVCFPLFHKLVNKVRPEHLWYLAGTLVAITWVVPFLANLLPAKPMFFTIPTYHVWFIQQFPPTRAVDFVLGMVMARIVLTGKWINLPLPAAIGLLFGGYLLSSNIAEPWSFVAATSAPIALVVAAAATADIKGTFSPFRSKLFVRGGELAFAFYLIHWMVLDFGHVALGAEKSFSTPVAIGLGVFAFAVSWALAWLMNTYIELPAMRRWARPGSKAAARNAGTIVAPTLAPAPEREPAKVG